MSRGDALGRLHQALEEHGCRIERNRAQCPAHDDTEPSLSIGQGKDGAVWHCQAGCTQEDVIGALGLAAADLFDEPRTGNGAAFEVTATYTYTDETGTPLFYAERRAPKDFRQYRIVNGSKVWQLGDVRRVLYRLPAVVEAVKNGETVYVTEGEKDVHAIEAAGGVATCNPMGAGKWRPEYSDALTGATVVIVADRDDPGREHARQVLGALTGKAAAVTVVEAAEGKDAADHLAARRGLGDFLPWGPETAAVSRLDQLRAALVGSAGLDRLPVPEPLIDGLLYRDSLCWLHGKPGHCKSFVALDWACCVAAGLPWAGRPVTQGPVLYVIAEGTSGLQARVRAWEDRAAGRTAVMFLPVAVQLLDGDFGALAGLAAELGCVLVVVDTQARVTTGAEENSAVDMGRLVDAAEKIRIASGACVMFVHHEARAGDNMRGSTALEGAATTILRVEKDGSRLQLTNPKQKDAAEADPMTLWVVPRLHSVVIAGKPDTPTLESRTASETKILSVLLESFGSTGASATALRNATGLAESTFHWALNRLVKDGQVQNLGTRTRTLYMPAQAQLPTGTPTTPTNSNSNDSNSNPPIGVAIGDGGAAPLELPAGCLGPGCPKPPRRGCATCWDHARLDEADR